MLERNSILKFNIYYHGLILCHFEVKKHFFKCELNLWKVIIRTEFHEIVFGL